MVSLGGSSVVGQAASGLILMYTRTIRAGEYVRIGDHEGTVTELGMFTTRIRTGLGEEITLSNSLIMRARRRRTTRAPVQGTGYVVDTVRDHRLRHAVAQVEAMLLEAARRTDDVLRIPPRIVFQTALSDFYVEYRLVCQAVRRAARAARRGAQPLHAHIQDVFNEHGVQIMSPHYVMDPKEPHLVPKEKWFTSPAKVPERKEA